MQSPVVIFLTGLSLPTVANFSADFLLQCGSLVSNL
jgi:hypothetical protein